MRATQPSSYLRYRHCNYYCPTPACPDHPLRQGQGKSISPLRADPIRPVYIFCTGMLRLTLWAIFMAAVAIDGLEKPNNPPGLVPVSGE